MGQEEGDYKGKKGDQRRAESRVLGNTPIGSVSESVRVGPSAQ